jgi:hypothetical protein
MTMKQMTELAEAIDAYLKRFEADPVINAEREVGRGAMKLRPFFNAQAYATRKFVCLTYVAYQGQSKLTAEEATTYLARLDSGFVGTHRQTRSLV